MRSTRGTTFERLTSFLKASATVAYFSGSSTKLSKVAPFVVKLFRPGKRGQSRNKGRRATFRAMKKTIRTLAPEIMRGRISPVTLTEEVLQRAERLNPTINSFITILRDRALRQAEAAEGAIREGKYSGPLHGIPIAMKDIFYIKGVRCTAASKILATNVPNYDSLVVKRLIGTSD